MLHYSRQTLLLPFTVRGLTQGSRVQPIRLHMRPNFLRCELKLNEVAPVLLAGGRLKKKKSFLFFFFLSPLPRLWLIIKSYFLAHSRKSTTLSRSLSLPACLHLLQSMVCTLHVHNLAAHAARTKKVNKADTI